MSLPSYEPRNLIRLWFCVVVGIALWFTPPPEGLNLQAWHVFGVFVTTIFAFLVRPLPMGPCVLLSLLVLGASGSLDSLEPFMGPALIQDALNSDTEHIIGVPDPVTEDDILNIIRGNHLPRSFKNSLKGFADSTVWLIVAAFLIAGAVIETGLGKRLALVLITRLGKTTLGLGYAITGAEILLAPFIPSNTARGGGLMAPIVQSLSHALGSEPVVSPRRAGQFLVMCGALDPRQPIAKEFVRSLEALGYRVWAEWPRTPHLCNDPACSAEFRTEFDKYSRITIDFFQRITRGP